MGEMTMRCGNCMEPYSAHIKRREAAPVCRKGGIYREATENELAKGYAEAFPEGPKPIATFRLDNPADVERAKAILGPDARSEEHTSELQSLMRISYAVFCLKKKNNRDQ